MDVQYVMQIAPRKYEEMVRGALNNGCTKESLYQLFQQGTVVQFEKLTLETTPDELSDLIYEAQLERRDTKRK